MAKAYLTLEFNRVGAPLFRDTIERTRLLNPFFHENLDLKPDYDTHECWLSGDLSCGFAVACDHELVNVFSHYTGQGSELMQFATDRYRSLHLNCYGGGYLENFYKRWGFEPTRREENRVAQGPGIVFMTLIR